MDKLNLKKKMVNYKKNKGRLKYVESRRRKPIKRNQFVLESTHGDSIGGHIYYIIENIQKKVPSCKIYVVSKKPGEHKQQLEKRGFKNLQVVSHLSEEYYEILAVSEFLINDTTFYPFFNKRKDQKYFIIWHGTPLKKMGKDMKNVIDVANVQRNFYMADKIIVNNEYTKDILVNSHNLKNIYNGKVVVGPSPRNSIFFNSKRREEIRKELGIQNKKILCYMPTWRGSISKVEKSTEIEKMFKNLDSYLDDNTILYVKLHDFEKDEIKETFKNIKKIPEQYETYEFLTATDALITDYSSVMYDYLNLNKPIILYTYDLEKYIEDRGMYENLMDYPFHVTSSLSDLKQIIDDLDNSAEYEELKKRFSCYDQKNGSEKIVNNILYNSDDNYITEYNVHNGKETVAILSGGFWNNGVTTALINTLENIDTNKRNYICFFDKNKIKPEHYYRLLNLPENVLFYPTTGEVNGNLSDRLLLKKYLWNEKFSDRGRKKQLRKIYREEFDRLFGDVRIDWFIHYTGFERKEAEMIRHIDAKKAMWVHTDMFEEYEAKKNFSKKIVFGAYQDIDKIVMVHDNLRENLEKNIPNISNKLVTVNNFLGENRTRTLAKTNLFETLENVKVDYSFNDNAYKSNNQIYLEDLKTELQNLFDEVKNKKHIDFKLVFNKIFDISSKYKKSDYMIQVIELEEIMIKDSLNELKNIFGKNENLIYQLAYNEFKKYILPKIKDTEREVHYYFPELNDNITKYTNLLRLKYNEEIDSENKELEKNINEHTKLIRDNYQILKREKDFSYKYNSLFVEHFDEIENYLNDSVLMSINQKSKNPIFDFYSHFRISKIKMLNAIFDENIKVYINIGRYDYQKGHDKLIDAFDEIYQNNKNVFLILVCPHGPLKSQTINRVRNSTAKDNIVILGGMNNPYPLLKECDAFVLSSNYEGLGLVVYEALAIDTDVITVDIPETIQYLKDEQAIIIPNSKEGLVEGLYKHVKNDYKSKTFDFDPLREKSIIDFEKLFLNN